MSTDARRRTVPNANNPRLLTRLLDMVARGVRSSRGLQEALGVDLRTVQYYTQACEWLGLLESADEVRLTGLGLELVYAGRRRPEVYARAVWATPFVAGLMEGRQGLPAVDVIARAIATEDPDLAPSTVLRRASAVRSLVAPALDHLPAGTSMAQQLSLPLAVRVAPVTPPRIDLRSGREYNPDVYRFLLSALIDHGELSLGHIRGLLDRARVEDVPIGGYVDLAVKRGDAVRAGERLAASRGAVRRRQLVESTTSIVLSDPGYRAWLDDLLSADDDPHARIRRDQGRSRYRSWDRRLFGHDATPEGLPADLDRLLIDRSLSSFPVAGDPGRPITPADEPFLDVCERSDLPITLPPTLSRVQGGLQFVNERLRATRQAGHDVGLPDLSYRPAQYHGGLLHPGEPLPRSVPDLRSLRARLLLNAPYAAMTAALLLSHRHEPGRIELVERKGAWLVRRRRRPLGGLLAVLDAFALSRGWLPCRRTTGGLPASELLGVLHTVGIAALVGNRAVLAEPFFAQLRTEAEEMELHARLAPLVELLASWLEGASASEVG